LAIAAPEGSWLNKYRLKIYSDMMRARGLFNPDYVTYASELSISGGKESALALFRKHPEITAVVCINDVVAIGAMQAAKELGMSVPQDVSILGSDGNPFIQLTTPKISSVMTPRSEIGRFAAEKLVNMINNDATDDMTSIFIPCSCFDGESIGPARTNWRQP
jgi:Transcriptional regulators